MERRNFLKRLFGAAAAATAVSVVPSLAKKSDETFTIDDITQICDGNHNLFYLKNGCWLDNELKSILGDRVVDKRYFSYYDPRRDLLIPVKDSYTKDDFLTLILWAKGEYGFNYYCNGIANHGVESGLCRFIKDDRRDAYHVDFFRARNPKL